MVKHAPGPWPLTVLPGDTYKLTLVTAQGNHYATTFDPSAARLIAAAPELLEAAQNARNVLAALATGDLKGVKTDSPALLALRAAIAKATGQEV